MTADPFRIEILAETELAAIRPLLAELILEEQRHYEHPQLTPEVVAQDVRRPVRPHFTGENIIFGARDGQDRVVGLCCNCSATAASPLHASGPGRPIRRRYGSTSRPDLRERNSWS